MVCNNDLVLSKKVDVVIRGERVHDSFHFFLPFLLLLVQAGTSWSECDDKQESSDDGHGLKEVVFEEITHGLPVRYHPECVLVDVNDHEEDDHAEGRQFGFVTHRHQHDENGTEQVEDYMEEGHVELKAGKVHQE